MRGARSCGCLSWEVSPVSRAVRLMWAVRGIAAVVIALTVMQQFGVSEQRDQLETTATNNASSTVRNGDSVRQVGAALADLCRTAGAPAIREAGLEDDCQQARAGDIEKVAPIETPDPVPTEPVVIVPQRGPRGVQGPGPTREQVDAAVSAYCAERGLCRGPAGVAGEPPTPSQVALAVASYCNARGECAGLQGERGESGEKGDPPTEQQIADAVVAYCADGRCRGETGERGPVGEQGPQGERGEKGDVGESGPQGEPGYPVSWTWTDQSGFTYTCVDTNQDHAYECSRDGGPLGD